MKKIHFSKHIDDAKKDLLSLSHITHCSIDGQKIVDPETNGYPFIEDNVSVIHNPLFLYLFSMEIKENGHTPLDFTQPFADGFKEGLFFLEKERIHINQLDDKDKRDGILDRLRQILHERQFNNNSLFTTIYERLPLVWTDEIIFRYGKFHGIITAIDQFAERAGLNPDDLKKNSDPAFTENSNENLNVGNGENGENPTIEKIKKIKKIKKHFNFFQEECPRKHLVILKDDDFDNLINWTILYYQNGFIVPKIDKPIEKVNTNKTYVISAFKTLFKELHPDHTYPDSLFDFFRATFSNYRSVKKDNFYKTKTADQLKILMKI